MRRAADLVWETTSTGGTGAVTLAGAVTGGYVTFSSVMSDQDTCYYRIRDVGNNAWEIGKGTYTVSTNSLSRDLVFASSNSDNLVNFAAVSKDVWIDPAASFLFGGRARNWMEL